LLPSCCCPGGDQGQCTRKIQQKAIGLRSRQNDLVTAKRDVVIAPWPAELVRCRPPSPPFSRWGSQLNTNIKQITMVHLSTASFLNMCIIFRFLDFVAPCVDIAGLVNIPLLFQIIPSSSPTPSSFSQLITYLTSFSNQHYLYGGSCCLKSCILF
jgi:hypothetical protein